ncbi:PRTRC system protein B [Sulfuricystis multivorans]|uniref:PRTRC system protein B n=1 Tax=Sulfuricystis multivorans TaxID=2211108 RepID=UPI000F84C71B|nr:PRTRC system protein B [Sulfuricystis multivorans]
MSFEVHDCAAMSVRLRTAILLYETHGYPHISYATIHPVDCGDDNGPPVIRAGRPADRSSLKAVCASLLKSSRVRSGVLADNILSVGLEHVVWWQRPGKRTYFFDCRPSAEGSVNVGKRAGIGPTPGIVFVAKDQSMWAYAVKGNNRPDADTQLYHLPAMNVWEDGKICTGSMPIPENTLAESVSAWEKSFWDSNFSHPNHPKPVNYKGGIHQFCIDLLDGKFKKFPQRVLRPIKGLTLGRLVDRLDGVTEG